MNERNVYILFEYPQPIFSVMFLQNFTVLCVISAKNSNKSVSQSVSHRVNFPGGVYDLYLKLFIVLSQCFEGYSGNFSCLI